MSIDEKALNHAIALNAGADRDKLRLIIGWYEAAKLTQQSDELPDNARTIDQFPPEGQRTKENEWEACYATLFRQMKPIMDENTRLKIQLEAELKWRSDNE